MRRQVRHNQYVTADEVIEAWRVRRGGALEDAEADLVRHVYEEQAAFERERTDQPKRGNFLAGCGLVLLMNVVVLVGLGILASSQTGRASSNIFLAMVLIGVIQLAYLVPIGVRLRATKQSTTLQGVIVAAAVTLLLSGACFALVGTSLTRA